MRHAAHKAAKVSNERFSVAKALFTSSRGSHTAKAVRMVQLANGEGAVVGLEPAVVEKLNEVAPMSRRAMREAARVAGRRSAFMASASLAALVGTAATAMAVGQQNASEMTFADNATTTTQMKRVSDNAAPVPSPVAISTLWPPPTIAVIGSLAKPVPPWTRIFCQSPLPTIPMSPSSWIRTPVFFLRASIRTTPPVIPAMTTHTASAHGGRIPVVHSLACLPEPFWRCSELG